MLKAVLFDLDGTLVDTLTDLANATNAVLERHGYQTHPTDSYRIFVGNGARRLVADAAGVFDETVIDSLLADFAEEYDRRCLETCRPYDGAVQTVKQLKARGVKLAVVTNKPERQAICIVHRFFGDVFSCIYGGTPDRPKKPDPTAVNEALHILGVQPTQALFVGDSDVDIYTAKNAGTASAGACWGFRGERELFGAGADRLLYSFDDLQKIFF
ncbi:MAG: HAD family hydrolase [Acutalibacteraceae bacterium]